jgi:RND family efflux transporter MFP subunit
MRIRGRTIVILAGIVLILVFLGLAGRGRREGGEEPVQKTPEVMAAVVEVEKVAPRNIKEFIESNGVVKAWQEADISPEVSGKVKRIFAEVGDYLEAGDPIFKLNDELLTLKVEKARAVVTQLEGHYLTSDRDLARKEALYRDGVISELDRDLARAKEKADKGLLEGAQASLKIAERDLRESTIRSPIDGTLAERLMDLGTTVSPQMNVACVVDASKVRIRIGVSEKEIHKIKKEQEVKVSVDAFPREEYQGTVFTVGTKANETTLTFPVEVVNHSEVTVVPQEAIHSDEGGSFVFVVQDGVARRVDINPDSIVDSQVILGDGLSPGDLLITVGSHAISEGTRVKVKNELP